MQACRRRQADIHGRGRSRARQGDTRRLHRARRDAHAHPRGGGSADRRARLRRRAALVDEYAWAIDIELCVFPQEGLTDNPGTEELMVEGLKRGAKVSARAPAMTPTAGQIHRMFELAREYDVDIDMHLDFGTLRTTRRHLVCDLTEQYKFGGRVAIGHATKFSTLDPAGRSRSPSGSPARVSRSRSCRRPICS